MKNVRNYFIGILTVMSFSMTGAQAAYDDAGTDYTTQTASTWIDMGPAMAPLNFTDFLVCLMKKTAASTIVNGTYDALTDASKCQTGQGSEKPEIAKMTVVTSRTDNSTPQTVNVWFDAGAGAQYIVESTITEGVSASAPFGSFVFSWQSASDANEKGTMSFTAGDTSTAVKMYKSEGTAQWVNGAIANDRATGQARVGIDAATYGVNFSKESDTVGYVNIQKTGDAAACFDQEQLSEYVYGYTLFDAVTGVKKDLSGPFQCTYVDADAATKYCHIGPYGAWFEGGETTATITQVTHEDGTVYTLVPDSTDANNDGVYLTVTGYTFDDPLIFNSADQTGTVQTAMGASSFLQYYGPRDLYGLPWECSTDGGATYTAQSGSNCDAAQLWRPRAGLANGTVLTDDTGKEYVTKVQESMKVMASVAASNCSTLTLDDGTVYPALTASDITEVTNTWADKPTVTAAPRVVEGVVQ